LVQLQVVAEQVFGDAASAVMVVAEPMDTKGDYTVVNIGIYAVTREFADLLLQKLQHAVLSGAFTESLQDSGIYAVPEIGIKDATVGYSGLAVSDHPLIEEDDYYATDSSEVPVIVASLDNSPMMIVILVVSVTALVGVVAIASYLVFGRKKASASTSSAEQGASGKGIRLQLSVCMHS
jgi:hypothetical protein